jgi:hypothetical protein
MNRRCPASFQEGRFATVTDVGGGMRWPCWRCRLHLQADEQLRCGREIVRSWRPDAGAKLVDEVRGRRWLTSPDTGEITYKRSNHRAGRAGMSRPNLWFLPRAFIRTGAMGAASSRPSLRPPLCRGRIEPRKARANHAARSRTYTLCCLTSETNRRRWLNALAAIDDGRHCEARSDAFFLTPDCFRRRPSGYGVMPLRSH